MQHTWNMVSETHAVLDALDAVWVGGMDDEAEISRVIRKVCGQVHALICLMEDVSESLQPDAWNLRPCVMS